jgi:hypothetical protein
MSDSSILSEKAKVILAQFPGPVTIRPSKWKMLAVSSPMFLLAAAAIGILWPFRLQLREWLIIGGFAGGPLLFIVTLTAISLVKDMPRITLDSEGFWSTALLGSGGKRWQDVSCFKSAVGVIAFVDASQPKGFWSRINRFHLFPSLYQLKSKDISRLMTAWRERALMPWSKASTARDD